jgi:hypothetical protein
LIAFPIGGRGITVLQDDTRPAESSLVIPIPLALLVRCAVKFPF